MQKSIEIIDKFFFPHNDSRGIIIMQILLFSCYQVKYATRRDKKKHKHKNDQQFLNHSRMRIQTE